MSNVITEISIKFKKWIEKCFYSTIYFALQKLKKLFKGAGYKIT